MLGVLDDSGNVRSQNSQYWRGEAEYVLHVWQGGLGSGQMSQNAASRSQSCHIAIMRLSASPRKSFSTTPLLVVARVYL